MTVIVIHEPFPIRPAHSVIRLFFIVSGFLTYATDKEKRDKKIISAPRKTKKPARAGFLRSVAID
jgi:hypothetical protein